jgi:uncharacterized protein
MWQVILVAVVIAVGGAGNAQAQPQTKKELVAKLLQLQQAGIENVGRQIAAQTSERVLQASGRAISRLAADKREAAAKDVEAEVKKFYEDLEPPLRKRATEVAATMLPALYEERFSEDELKTVIAWLESPVSKKMQQMDNENANALAQKVVADTRSMVEPKLKALDLVLGKRLGVSPASGAGAASVPKK